MAQPVELPPRYLPRRRLGRGGGGEVWEVEDLADGRLLALKFLAPDARNAEMQALVREASALSGLEGLGVPRVLRFGRLPDGRPFLLRELVAGASLAERLLAGIDAARALGAVARAADQLTAIHRAGLLHGDVKPGNIIVGDDDRATLVDLGLATPLRERGGEAKGLSPRTAAPELLEGGALTVRGEVYSLGATLREVLEATEVPERRRAALDAVVARATSTRPSDRHPSVDELAVALRTAARLEPASTVASVDAAWPIVGLDAHVHDLCERAARTPPGTSIAIVAPPGAGRTSLLRRLAWSMGIAGTTVAWVEGGPPRADRATELELTGPAGLLILVDAPERMSDAARARVARALEGGARAVATGELAGHVTTPWRLPGLDGELAGELVRRAIPSLSDAATAALVERAAGLPGALRALVRRVGGAAVVSPEDLSRLLAGTTDEGGARDPVEALTALLDEGRLLEARALVDALSGSTGLEASVARARYFIYAGELVRAMATLDDSERLARLEPRAAPAREHALYRARALVRRGAYEEAWTTAQRALSAAGARGAEGDAIDADATACVGTAESLLGRHEAALTTLARAVAEADRVAAPRVTAIAYGSLGLAQQRADRLADARDSYTRALAAAERAGDAGNVATLRLNLAALASQEGDVAAALGHLEAAVDMGARAGRAATALQARINLANLDLYLGRLSRAAASIDALLSCAGDAAPSGAPAAQLLGLQAELAARTGAIERALELYDACAAAFDALSRPADAAEVRVEAVLTLAREGGDAATLSRRLAAARDALAGTSAHRAALALAEGVTHAASGATARAAAALDAALDAAREAGQREWTWRALSARARLAEDEGRTQAARRDAEAALAVLEDIASKLPRDLREVYWNDPRRREARALVAGDSRHPATDTRQSPSRAPAHGSTTRMLEQDRFARILEINRDLARVRELPTVLERVVHHACALVRADRGFVVLLDDEGQLVVHATRAGDEATRAFSRSVAERAIDSGEAIVSLSARDDERMRSFQSVHVLELEAIACVPIHAPDGRAIGALYLEGRGARGNLFERELATLTAFAEQAAIAIVSLRLLADNEARAAELARSNTELAAAKARLAELLHAKQARLDVVRKDLKNTRAVLHGHFGYRGLVGTSDAMRRVYALIERVAATDLPVLITGESGTGKEVVARAIHEAGARAKQPFTGINCGAIPANLLETELFGHERGAFTGADRARPGLLRATGSGTVLLDEVGEMPLSMQPGLLRVLQERRVRPIGGSVEEPIDARVIAATHRDLDELVARGTFREDLVYRLRVVEIRVPPLRARPEDIPALVDHFLTLFAARHQRPRGGVTRDALRKLGGHAWPGNVRQLHHTLLNAWILGDGGELAASDLELPGRLTDAPAPSAKPRSAGRSRPSGSRADHEAREKARILEALRESGWNRLKAAQRLGIPRRTFYRRLSEYGIQ